jgi:hypothetical protein
MLTNILSHHEKYLSNYYVSESEYRNILGIGTTRFWQLKRQGKLEKAIQSPSRGFKHKRYHRYFNPITQRIELPELKRSPINQTDKKHSQGKDAKRK